MTALALTLPIICAVALICGCSSDSQFDDLDARMALTLGSAPRAVLNLCPLTLRRTDSIIQPWPCVAPLRRPCLIQAMAAYPVPPWQSQIRSGSLSLWSSLITALCLWLAPSVATSRYGH